MTRLVLALLVVACGNKPADPPAEGVSDVDLTVDNMLVPEEWRARLHFVAGSIVNQQTFELAVPRGWKPGLVPGSLEAVRQGRAAGRHGLRRRLRAQGLGRRGRRGHLQAVHE